MKTSIVIASVVLGLTVLATPVFAQPSPFPTPRKGANLAQAATRSCEARQSAIQTRMKNLTNMATNMERVFDAIATRVENFYTNTVLPSGKSVSNYDALVADIATKKGVVDADLAAAQTQVDAFSCSTDNPRELLTQFRLDMQKVKADLKNYRTSVRNLIVAVRPLAPEATGTPEPTPTP